MNQYRGHYANLSRMTQRWLSHPPPPPAEPVTTVGLPCPEERCHIIACGTTAQLAADRLAEHKRRCHAG